MDFNKMIGAGIKSFIMVFIATVATVLAGALVLATGYKPDGVLAQTVFTYIVLPLLTSIIAMLNNWIKHKDDPKPQ